jgi:hypothetical protein
MAYRTPDFNSFHRGVISPIELPTVDSMGDNGCAGRAAAKCQEASMSEVVIEHVNVAELPDAWRARLAAPHTARVTVRIEAEEPAAIWPPVFFSRVAGVWLGEPLTRAPQGSMTPRATLD